MHDLLDTSLTPVAKTYSFKPLQLLFWLAFLLIGLFFRSMHWPFSDLIILGTTAGITAYSWSGWIRLRGKDLVNNLVSILSVAWLVILVWGTIYNDGHPYNYKGLILFMTFFGVFFAMYLIISHFKYRFK